MSPFARVLCVLGVLLATAPAGADSESPYRLRDLRALAESADVIVVARVTRVDAGQRGALVAGRMLPTTDTRARVVVDHVVVGDASLGGATLEVLFTAADDPLQPGSPDPLLLFLAREGASHRLAFAGLYGAVPVRAGRLQMWLEGHARGDMATLASLEAQLAGWAARRVRLVATAELAGASVLVRWQFTNAGPGSVRILPPSYCFDAIWARAVRPGSDERLGPDWAGVSHWPILRARERMRRLAPGRSTTFQYRVPRSLLQMTAPGDYLLGLRYEPSRPSRWSPANDGRAYPDDAFLGQPPETTVRVTVGTAVRDLRHDDLAR